MSIFKKNKNVEEITIPKKGTRLQDQEFMYEIWLTDEDNNRVKLFLLGNGYGFTEPFSGIRFKRIAAQASCWIEDEIYYEFEDKIRVCYGGVLRKIDNTFYKVDDRRSKQEVLYEYLCNDKSYILNLLINDINSKHNKELKRREEIAKQSKEKLEHDNEIKENYIKRLEYLEKQYKK